MNDELIENLAVAFLMILAIGGGLYFLLRHIWAGLREDVKKRLRRQKVILRDDLANFYGLESKGLGQARGNGILALTDKDLFFLQAVPRRETRIPIKAIAEVTHPRSHLGKSNMSELLRVEFEADGNEDAIAWQVRDLGAWKEALEKARGG